MKRSWFIPLLTSACACALAAPPERVEIAYELRRNGTPVAEIVDRLEHDGARYGIVEHWKGRGFFSLLGEARRISRGAIGPQGLRPREYEDRRTGRATARATLDWETMRLTRQYKGAPETHALPENAQDRLSFLYSFAFAPPGEMPLTLSVADGKGVSAYVFRVAGRERLAVPAGEFDALRLVKKTDGPGERVTELWLAADRDRLPLRVLVTEPDGTRLDQVATRVVAP